MRGGSAQERFWRKVSLSGDCWIWDGAKDRDGYGRFYPQGRSGKPTPSHRFSYEQLVHEIPEGLVIDHLCRTRACVNPWHLDPVTPTVNVLRGDNHERGKTCCHQGHAFDEANTYLRPDGRGRECRACRRQKSATSAA